MFKYSIIVPVYNAEAFLNQSICSIFNQSYCNFEIILVNDGSTDSSLLICEEYQKKDSRIVLINKKNGGPNSSRKAGSLVASGDYIVCVDSDDYIDQSFLENIDSVLSKYNVDLLCLGYDNVENKGVNAPILNKTECGFYDDLSPIILNYLYDDDEGKENYGSLLYTLWTKVVKTEIFVKCQSQIPDSIKNGEDLLLICHFLKNIKNCYVSDITGYHYRDNPKSITKKRTAYDIRNVFNVVNELYKVGVLSDICIEHYFLMSLFIILRDLAIQSKNYQSFKIEVSNCITNAISIKSKFNLKKKELFRLYLVRKRKWFFLFCLSKFCSQ